MSTSLLAAGVATLCAAVLAAMLARLLVRTPRPDLAAWVLAAIGLTLALAAQALGYKGGFGPTTFRVVQVSGQVLAPLGLLWGVAELAGMSAAGRFAARLALIALGVVSGVVLATDVLGSTAFSRAWPAASSYYEVIPAYVLDLIDVVTVIWGGAAAVVAGVRSRRDQAWREAFPAALTAVFAAWITLGLRAPLPGDVAYVVVCLLAAVLAWFAGRQASRVPLAELHAEIGGDPEDLAWGDRRRGYGGYHDDTGYGERYRPDTGGYGAADTGYGFYRTDTGGVPVDTGAFGPDTGYSLYRADTGAFWAPGPGEAGEFGRLYRDDAAPRPSRAAPGRPGDPYGADGAAPGLVETGDVLPVVGGMLPPGPAVPPGADTTELYGQIAIYTLIDGRTEDFDRLAKDVVDKVKQREPNTLVYVLHAVPSAPLQRILYEVYRNAAAYEEHARQPYVERFEEERKPCVLATNVIELGVRQAKVAPLDQQAPPPPGRRDIWGQELR